MYRLMLTALKSLYTTLSSALLLYTRSLVESYMEWSKEALL